MYRYRYSLQQIPVLYIHHSNSKLHLEYIFSYLKVCSIILQPITLLIQLVVSLDWYGLV